MEMHGYSMWERGFRGPCIASYYPEELSVLLILGEEVVERYQITGSFSFSNSKNRKKKKKSKGQLKVFCLISLSLAKKIIMVWAPGWLSVWMGWKHQKQTYLNIFRDLNRGKKRGEYRKCTFTPEVIDKINYLITALIK